MLTHRVALTGSQGVGRNAARLTATDLINILDTVELPIVLLGRDLTVVCFNRAAEDVFGFSPSDFGRPCLDVSVLAGLPRLDQQCSNVITGGVDTRIDFHLNDRSFVVRISPYPASDRQATGAVLTFTNVTAYRASVAQAIYERECTKAILNTVAAPLVVLSADQRIQSGNRAFYTMFGVSRDLAQDVPLHEFANAALASSILQKQLHDLLAGSDAFQPFEVDRVSTAKGPRTLIIDAHPLSFPGHFERRVLVTLHDITARKEAEVAKDLRSEEELRRSEAFLAEGQRLSSTGSFSWKVTTDKITWSEELYRIFEFAIGVPVTLQLIRSRVHPEDLPMLDHMIEQSRRAVSDFEYEHRLLMPDRSVKYLHLTAHGFRHNDSDMEYIGAVQDVTQRRLSEEALGQARSELARVLRIKTLAVLTASIAHELNQPLSGILTNASTCQRMLSAEPPNVEGARETARRTIRDSNRASDVITRLRALFARRHTTAELVDLNEATKEVVALSTAELQKSRVMLRMELEDDLPLVHGDRVQLQQVIVNLLRNGCDAMNTVEGRTRMLRIRTEVEEGDRVRLSVQDAGIGFDVKQADKLFEAFYTTKSDGMGIGLSVSRSIIESHYGRLWATLNHGPGATFTFSIPRRCESIDSGAEAA